MTLIPSLLWRHLHHHHMALNPQFLSTKEGRKIIWRSQKTSAGGERQGFLVQPVRFSITSSAAEKFEDKKSDSGESNISSESEIEDAGDNPATFAVVDRLKISSEPQRAASCTDSGEKCVSRVNSAGAASFMFCVYLPFSSLFWFRRWLSRARLNFSHREIAPANRFTILH